METAFKMNLNVKLYFLVGLPTETHDDLEDMVNLIKDLQSMAPHKDSLRISAVSYTHLDVYKRQMHNNPSTIKMGAILSPLNIKYMEVKKGSKGGLNRSEYPIPLPANNAALASKS